MRPAQDGSFAIDSVESTISLKRETGFDVSGLIQPQLAVVMQPPKLLRSDPLAAAAPTRQQFGT